MRLFLKIKQEHKHVTLTRINFKSANNTSDQLIEFIAKYLKIPTDRLILRTDYKGKYSIRLVKGWDIGHYQLEQGIKIDIQIISGREDRPLADGTCAQTDMNIQIPSQNQIIQQEEEEYTQTQKLVIQRHEQLLQLINRKQNDKFCKLIKQGHQQLGQCENYHFKSQVINILSHLGNKGWAAIHYVCFNNNLPILQTLISLNVNLNIKTSDDWLPIQLAIDKGNTQIIIKLLSTNQIDLNVCTSRGTALSMAVKSRKAGIVQKLIQKEIKIDLKDNLGRTPLDLITEKDHPQIYKLLKQQQRRQSLTFNGFKNYRYHSLVSSYRGQVIKVRSPPRKDTQYYIFLNTYDKTFIIYKSRESYPKQPKQVIPLNLIKCVRKLKKSQISWYMKDDLFYFMIEERKKLIFACNFQQTVDKWVSNFEQSLKHIKEYDKSIQDFSRNDLVILDRIQKSPQKSQKNKPQQNILQTLSFISLKSKYSEESPLKTKQSSEVTEQLEKQQKVNPQLLNSIEKEEGEDLSYKFSHFKIEKLLGEGSFGTVYLAKHKNGNFYALKCFKKKKLVVQKQIKFIIAELNILKQIDHPFIVNLNFTFQTPSNVYLGLDYCSGGDLGSHLMRQVNFPEDQCRIYAAQILLALMYLHEIKIIYRDLKPENIMIGRDGHIKLVDFGLSKQVTNSTNYRAKSFCGSPAYISPQMLLKKGVGKESDYYCFGAVVYEMLIGEPPYFSDDIETLYSNIQYGKLTFPKTVSQKAKSLLYGLLERSPSKRLGYKNPLDIKNHEFFKGINWQKLERKQISAPKRECNDDASSSQQQFIKFIHQDEDYTEKNKRINRFINFTFSKQTKN